MGDWGRGMGSIHFSGTDIPLSRACAGVRAPLEVDLNGLAVLVPELRPVVGSSPAAILGGHIGHQGLIG